MRRGGGGRGRGEGARSVYPDQPSLQQHRIGSNPEELACDVVTADPDPYRAVVRRSSIPHYVLKPFVK